MNQYELAIKVARDNQLYKEGELNLRSPGYYDVSGNLQHTLPTVGTVFLTYSRQIYNVVTHIHFDWEQGDYYIKYAGYTASGKWMEYEDYWFTGYTFKTWSERMEPDYRGL